jgi:hypothetical protein
MLYDTKVKNWKSFRRVLSTRFDQAITEPGTRLYSGASDIFTLIETITPFTKEIQNPEYINLDDMSQMYLRYLSANSLPLVPSGRVFIQMVKPDRLFQTISPQWGLIPQANTLAPEFGCARRSRRRELLF